MKKKLLVVSVVVVLLCAMLVFAGVASAASVQTGAGVYFGEYGNLFAGREDQAERLENCSDIIIEGITQFSSDIKAVFADDKYIFHKLK